jgi:hypothetical protein
LAAPISALVAVGCDSDEREQWGFAECATTDSIPLELDETSPAGFSARDVLAFSEGDFSGTMVWEGQTESPLAFSVARTGGSVTYSSDLSGRSMSVPGCPGTIRIAVDIELSTEDRRLAEAWPEELSASPPSSATSTRGLTEIAGTLDPEANVADSDRYEAIPCELSSIFAPAGVSGSIIGLGARRYGDADDRDSMVTYELVLVGNFGPVTRGSAPGGRGRGQTSARRPSGAPQRAAGRRYPAGGAGGMVVSGLVLRASWPG